MLVRPRSSVTTPPHERQVRAHQRLERAHLALLRAADEVLDLLRVHQTTGPSPRATTVSRAKRGSLSGWSSV